MNQNRRSGRLLLVILVVLLLVGGIGSAGVLWLLRAGNGASPPSAAAPTNTSRVVRQTLLSQVDVAGQLSYGTSFPLEAKASGTVTWLPSPGSVLRRGQSVARVDDKPVVLLYGTLPMYRALGVTRTAAPSAAGSRPAGSAGSAGSAGAGSGSGADLTGGSTPTPTPTASSTPARVTPLRGPDVRQLENNLAALGYSGFTVDDTFSLRTEEAVKRWQRDLGRPATGRVEVGDVIFQPAPVRLDHTLVRVGAQAGSDVVAVTGTSRQASADVQLTDAAWAVPGARVRVSLPDGRTVAGTVRSVGTVASSGQSSDLGSGSGQSGGAGAPSTVPVTFTLPNQAALGRISQGPVQISYVSSRRPDVLTVPVASLLALAGGGFGLELVHGTQSQIVAVRVGLFSGGNVEVSGTGLAENEMVRLPG